MRSVLFITRYPLDELDTLKPKFDGQMSAVKNLGYDVYHVAYDRKCTYLVHGNERRMIKKIRFGNTKGYRHTFAYFDMFSSVRKILKDHQFDYIYMRSCPMSYQGYKMCEQIRKASKTKWIVEIPTYPGAGEKPSSWLRAVYGRYSDFFWDKVGGKCDLYTLIGEPADSYRGVKAINIENGICVEQLRERKHIKKADGKIHFLALASMSVWQGYDRFIEGIHLSPDELKDHIVFHMVGPEGDGSLRQWSALADKYGLQEQVMIHGPKLGKELDDIFDIADVGVCGLGVHRKGELKGSALKVREYTGRGLPFIYSLDDSCVSDELVWCKRVEPDESPIDMEKMVEFAEKIGSDDEIARQMREYAKDNMSWEKQFKKVFKEFE